MSPRTASPAPRTRGVVGTLVLVVPLLTAAGGSTGQAWPDAPDPNIEAAVHGIPFESRNRFTHAIPELASFVSDARTEESEDGTTTVTISSDVLFDFDEADLGERSQDTIDEVAERLQGVSGTVEVVGHTDSVGDAEYNQRLSEKRAEAVTAALEERLGSTIEIESSGKGAEEPLEDAEGVEDPSRRTEIHARNRRVEISFEGE